MKKILDDRSNTHMNFYFLQFTNFLHQYHRAIEVIVPLFVRIDFSKNSIPYFNNSISFLALSRQLHFFEKI